MQSDELKAFLKRELEGELHAVLSALQRAGSDAMGFGRFEAMRMKTAEEWERYDWKPAYRTLSVTFSVTVMLSHSPHEPQKE
jgi:hypothetical protein